MLRITVFYSNGATFCWQNENATLALAYARTAAKDSRVSRVTVEERE